MRFFQLLFFDDGYVQGFNWRLWPWVFASYAHMQQGSIRVSRATGVKRGQALG
jgi:murein DD-endopeptidase MepM/ murein hydrolase activator NlpD